MITKDLTLEVYVTPSGKVPFEEWLYNLDKQPRAIIRGRIERVRHGLLGDCKSLGDSLFELRVNFGPGYRIYFAIVNNKIVLLLSGGDKGSQKKDIEKAKNYLKDWETL